MTTTVTAPIRKQVQVACDPDRAFDLWTDLTAWWPLATHAIADDVQAAVMECRVGGRIHEVAADGTERDWGEVLVYDRPNRLVFSFGAWRGRLTEVEVRFTRVEDGTLVDLEHRGWENLGPDAADIRPRYVPGWDEVLARYVGAI